MNCLIDVKIFLIIKFTYLLVLTFYALSNHDMRLLILKNPIAIMLVTSENEYYINEILAMNI